MQFKHKEGVALAYEEKGTGRPMVFLHGTGCDHTYFAPQVEYFAATHRVINVDLRGHGQSDAPHQDYTITLFAEDIAWLCNELGAKKPILVGHSMGANIALELAGRYQDVPASIIMLDPVMFLSAEVLESLKPLFEAIQGEHAVAAYKEGLASLTLPTDQHSAKMIAALQVPRHVLSSAFLNQIQTFDAAAAASRCTVPAAYVATTTPFRTADVDRLQSLIPHLITAKTLGSGHLCMIEVPDQINAMVSRFLQLYPSPT